MLRLKNKPFYKESALRFQCSGCGRCCYGTPGIHYIGISQREVIKLRTHLGLTRDWFRRRYLEPLENGGTGIRLNPDGACPFLDSHRKCTVYRVRPLQCRTYPFWPEVVCSKNDWEKEARRCEGINRGDVISLEVVEKNLRKTGE